MDLSEPLLREVGSRSEYLRPRDLAALGERYRSPEGTGVPRAVVLDHVAAALTPLGREEAKAALETCREEGRLVEDTDQHPAANVYLPDSPHDPDVA